MQWCSWCQRKTEKERKGGHHVDPILADKEGENEVNYSCPFNQYPVTNMMMLFMSAHLSKINIITDLAVKIREDLLCMIHPRRRG